MIYIILGAWSTVSVLHRERGLYMKRLIVISCLLLLTVACSSGSYDEKGYDEIEKYMEEISVAVDGSVSAVSSWMEDRSSDEMENTVESAKQIKAVNDKYWKFSPGDRLNRDEISNWEIKMVKGDNEWTIDGEELYDALAKAEEDSDHLANTILEMEKSEEVNKDLSEATGRTKASLGNLRTIMLNE